MENKWINLRMVRPEKLHDPSRMKVPSEQNLGNSVAGNLDVTSKQLHILVSPRRCLFSAHPVSIPWNVRKPESISRAGFYDIVTKLQEIGIFPLNIDLLLNLAQQYASE
jgi:hypothetical protein